jgi:uncharacterized damage-inducible protein DinB
MNLKELEDLYRHMEWADASVWRALLSAPDAMQDQKLREYFHHLHLVQRAFLRAWRQESTDAPYPAFEAAPDLMLWGQSYFGELFAHFQTLSDDQLARPAQLPWADIVESQIGRSPAPLTLGEMMLQVPLHSLYHRGQINARLRAVGGVPPTVDYIVWVWLGRPAADWNFEVKSDGGNR